MKESMRIYHLPDYHKDNPYQSLLVKNLTDIGFNVQYGKRKVYFKVIDFSIFFNLTKNFSKHIFHLHWQHPFLLHEKKTLMIFKGFLFVFQLASAKLMGLKIIWTVHNLKNHENKYVNIEKFFCKIIAKLTDAIIVHCEASKIDILRQFKVNENKVFCIPQGNYINVYKEQYTRNESKIKLGLKDAGLTFLFLGLIRPYKGILDLIKAFKRIKNRSARLVIAGRVENGAHADIITKESHLDSRIKTNLQYIDDDEIEVYLKAADVVVLPYKDIINSGSAILAMSFGKVVIGPKIGCMEEILDRQLNLLYDPKEHNGLKNIMAKVIEYNEDIALLGRHNADRAQDLDWKRIAYFTGNIYHNC